MQKLRVGILGATGAVGQEFVELLNGNSWFEIVALTASERSAGKAYREAVNWIGSRAIPAGVAEMTIRETRPDFDADFVFSGLDAGVAGDIEATFAEAGYPVISYAVFCLTEKNVPLPIAAGSPDHIEIIHQKHRTATRPFGPDLYP